MTQQLKLNSEIDIALRKVSTGPVTAGMLLQRFAETVQPFVGKNEACRFINTKVLEKLYMDFWLWLNNMDFQHFL